MRAAKAQAFGLLVALVASLSGCGAADSPSAIELRSPLWRIVVEPASLALTAHPRRGAPVQVSAPQPGLGPVRDLAHTDTTATWTLDDPPCRVALKLEDDTLHVRLQATEPADIVFPLLGRDAATRAYVLPLFEGSYVPVDHPEWLSFLRDQSPMSTTEGLSMPFLGVDLGQLTLTYILAYPFQNKLTFSALEGRIAADVTHTFGEGPRADDYTVLVRLGPPSPIEPARQYRRYLVDTGSFVSLSDKINQIPGVRKLLGAPHVYLWGAAALSRRDVRSWPSFAAKLLQQSRAAGPSPARRIWQSLPPEARDAVEELASHHSYPYLTGQVADALSALLSRPDFYDQPAWHGLPLPAEAQRLLGTGPAKLPTSDLIRLNSLLLAASFPGEFISPDQWGDGLSVKMMDRLAAAGLDRLWLGLDSWQGGFRHPAAVRKAKQLGYLIGTYDSYASIHHPDEPETWETAQFDLRLYETGAILGPDGKPKPGFQRKGYLLSPIAAKPYVSERVTRLMSDLPERFNSWFIDCDAYGDLQDDYSPDHPMTERDDMQARLDRMAWIRDTYGLVIGSERGAAYAAPALHFAHGMMTPVIGWGDPDLQKDKQSPYYLGAWWPPDGPQVMMKHVPLKPKYRTPYFDPRFRLPLYQTVFHDSLITTHHWGYASLKFTDQVQTVALLELLYNVPPLYHLNLDEFDKHEARITAHYRFFSPLHRELATQPLTDFTWLTPDRLVQRTVFGDRVELVANFTSRSFPYSGTALPPHSLLAHWLTTGATRIFQPSPFSGG